MQSKTKIILIFCLFAGLPLPNVGGQNVIEDGTALDSNLQIGSGGVNPLRPERDYSLGNDIITGNVTGAAFFREDVGYGAPGEFMGELGSDDLFRFRARSAPMANPYQRSLSGQPYGPRSVYRSFVSPNAGRFLSPTSRRIVRPNASGLYRGYDITRGIGVPIAGITSPVAQTISLLPLAQGRMLEVIASPLLGIRQNVHDLSTRSNLLNSALSDGTRNRADIDKSDDEESNADEKLLVEQLDSQVKRTELPSAGAKMFHSSIELGWQLDNRLRPRRLLDSELTAKDKLEQIERRLFDPLDQQFDESADDVYMDLLQQINDRYKGLLDGESGLADSDATAQLPDAEPSLLSSPILLEPPTDDQLHDAAAKRTDAFEIALGIKPELNLIDLETLLDPEAGSLLEESGGQDKAQSTAPEPDTTLGARFDPMQLLDVEDRRKLERILSAINHDQSGLKTLAGERATHINRKLRKGELLLIAKRYFDAEHAYRQVLIAQPRHPMARVGVIHSQLGAGMIRSAAFNLRTLFEQHPEMIATRYQPNLLPAGSRLKKVRADIEKMINRSHQLQPPIVLAYLGYQVGQRQLVVYGLDLAQARSPLDPLIVLLRRIWLDEKSIVPARADTNDEPSSSDSAGQSPETSK